MYVFPDIKLIFPKQNYNVLSPRSYTLISERDLNISRIGLPILLQENMWTEPENIQISHRHMNVEIGTEAVHLPEKEYINRIFLAVWISRSLFPFPQGKAFTMLARQRFAAPYRTGQCTLSPA
jgi:hypothetical protein